MSRNITLREWLQSQPLTTDKISIKKLRLFLNAGYDIWGRQRVQPVEISVEAAIKGQISSSADSDTVDSSTIHYGHVAKLILDRMGESGPNAEEWRSPHNLLHELVLAVKIACVDPSIIATVYVETLFPKASIFGEGVAIRLYHNPVNDYIATTLSLERLKLPALIGVNDHERRQKQMVVITVLIDRVKEHISHTYFELEQLVVKTVEESTFQTIESLTEELARRIIKYFIIPRQQPNILGTYIEPAGVRVSIEKPSAVPMADAPCVEIYRSADMQDPFGRRAFTELGNKRLRIPFPLDGRLDDFLHQWKQD